VDGVADQPHTVIRIPDEHADSIVLLGYDLLRESSDLLLPEAIGGVVVIIIEVVGTTIG